jgi:hypothetical protein
MAVGGDFGELLRQLPLLGQPASRLGVVHAEEFPLQNVQRVFFSREQQIAVLECIYHVRASLPTSCMSSAR